ncbi:hypothetical protein GCM10025857_05180 [Alicyclobacillus contaminans]|uniref:DUF881 domain-containing protein n=1 Tax=Alicyclobacillus contaminans TaxID=392016 RepID=UPI000422D14F|nr:DUF881 domain-containing protein [Alicyclobacillus contaminans]GMA49161.1 hypothetical protein GCM10025857_05180 [Alicyclobacillus contaminans]
MLQTRSKLALSLTVVAAALGFMVALQYKQQLAGRGALGYSPSDTEQKKLLVQLQALKATNVKQEQQLQSITTKIAAYEKQTGNSGELSALRAKLEDERILAGTTAVEGPGVQVTLMDGTPPAGADTEQYLTHDWDVRSVINELFTAGAEAVSINGYRVVATSGVFCTGPVVKVNDHSIGAPFTIQAIGDPQALKSGLTLQGGILDQLRQRGVNVSDVQLVQTIKMPPFTGSLPSDTGSN